MPALDAESDELIRRAAARDEAAFRTLMDRHAAVIWAVCLRITRDRTDAEDAVQETLIAAWRALPGFRGEARLSTWLYRIASNAALAVVRRRQDADELDESVPAGGDGFDERVAQRDEIDRALAAVPPAFRAALVLREFAGLSYEEIAEHQGIRVETVKTRLHRARALVREALRPQ